MGNVDFGDILDAWDRQTVRVEKPVENNKKTEAGEEPVQETRTDPLTAWLRIKGVQDKDAELGEERKKRAGERRRRLLNKKPDGVLDLHGLNRDEAWAALETFFEESRRQEFEKVLVVHGKGNHSEGEAVLKRTVREFIERCPFAGENGQGGASGGGSGATWVLLKLVQRSR